jgi:flagellar motility protein MotE (MotC chaperone)
VDKLSNSVTEHKEKQPGVMVETKDNDRIQREMSDILDSYFVVTENTKKEENSKKENERLKSQLNKLKKQVQALEEVLFDFHFIFIVYCITKNIFNPSIEISRKFVIKK